MAKQTRAVKRVSTGKSATKIMTKKAGASKSVKKAAKKTQAAVAVKAKAPVKGNLTAKAKKAVLVKKKASSKLAAVKAAAPKISAKKGVKAVAPVKKAVAKKTAAKEVTKGMLKKVLKPELPQPESNSQKTLPVSKAVNKSQVIQARSARTGKVVIQLCREIACDSGQVGSGYCRLHYIKNWKKLKNRELVLAEGHLNRFLEDILQKFPQKALDGLYKDLSSEAEFAKTVIALNLSDPAIPSDDFDSDDDDALDGPILGSMKKETFDDLGDY